MAMAGFYYEKPTSETAALKCINKLLDADYITMSKMIFFFSLTERKMHCTWEYTDAWYNICNQLPPESYYSSTWKWDELHCMTLSVII